MDDLISRQAAIDRATKEHDFFRGAVTVSDKARRDELLNVMCWLGELPSAQPKRIKSKWALHTYMPHNKFCLACRNDSPYNKRWDFCPNCGAEMEVTT